MGDRIRLAGMSFYGYHGVHAAEQEVGQRFIVDVELALDLAPAGQSDDLNQTVDYGLVYEQVRAIIEGPPRRLLEAVAERVAAALLTANAPVEAITVTIHKPSAPIRAATVTASVTIERRRG